MICQGCIRADPHCPEQLHGPINHGDMKIGHKRLDHGNFLTGALRTTFIAQPGCFENQ